MSDATDKLIDKLVDGLHARFDWTLIPDFIEVPVLKGLFKLGLEFLPPNYIGWIQSAADGIDETEAASLKEWLVGLMAKYGSDVPEVFRGVVAGLIVEALRRGDAVLIGE